MTIRHNESQYDTDRARLRFGQSYEFIINDGTVVDCVAHDSCVITGSLFGSERIDICWSKIAGFRIVDDMRD